MCWETFWEQWSAIANDSSPEEKPVRWWRCIASPGMCRLSRRKHDLPLAALKFAINVNSIQNVLAKCFCPTENVYDAALKPQLVLATYLNHVIKSLLLQDSMASRILRTKWRILEYVTPRLWQITTTLARQNKTTGKPVVSCERLSDVRILKVVSCVRPE